MSIISRIVRGLRRAAPTGLLAVLWAGLGAAGFMLFFQDVREPTFPLILFILVFGVGVWLPYFRFFFVFAEEALTPDGPSTAWSGVLVGAAVALLSVPPILMMADTGHADLEFLICAPLFLTLVGWNRGLRKLERGADV